MGRVRELFKKSAILIKLYEDIGMMKYFYIASNNARKAKLVISKEEIEKIKSFENIHFGKRCFIVGSGPSLKVEDLETIKDEISFGVNSDYKVYDRTSWRPKYYAILDDNAFGILGEECYKDEIYDAFFCSMYHTVKVPNGVRLVDYCACHFMIGTIWNKLMPQIFPIAKYSKDISRVVYSGKTVVYAVIQIAAYMGFKEIYLLGVDCNYNGEKKHADGMGYQSIFSIPKDKLERNGLMMRLQFEEMKKKIPADVHIYNASEESLLDVFPKVKIKEVLGNG